MNEKFTIIDYFILHSIGFGKNGLNIGQIMKLCNLLTHEKNTSNEFCGAINKLILNDYLKIENCKYFTTEKAKKFYETNKNPNENYQNAAYRLGNLFVKL
ncbi:MAG: hypothetical protein A2Y15_08420 [Clostridiales bacterium GWF2_36_10]|nr:MAG: hypothetical protein A2Y15_08420 [Clostridiales bacterium GWF2_36_10]HAN20326.1 hypothetical protein [Clostridiales bacterium]